MKDLSSIGLDVSRETLGRLHQFESLVLKWNGRINLVSRKDVSDLWFRHIVDSAQAYNSNPADKTWVDIGSGGGFPGLVVAILSRELRPERSMTLVESDQRKATFLRVSALELGLDINVISSRVEELDGLGADIVSARALADLDVLLSFSARHLKPSGTAILMKGKAWREEVDRAKISWRFRYDYTISKTDPEAAILKVQDIQNA